MSRVKLDNYQIITKKSVYLRDGVLTYAEQQRILINSILVTLISVIIIIIIIIIINIKIIIIFIVLVIFMIILGSTTIIQTHKM